MKACKIVAVTPQKRKKLEDSGLVDGSNRELLLQSFVRMHFGSDGTVSASKSYFNVFIPFKFIKKSGRLPEDTSFLSLIVKPTVAAAKLRDTENLLHFLPDAVKGWYGELLKSKQ